MPPPATHHRIDGLDVQHSGSAGRSLSERVLFNRFTQDILRFRQVPDGGLRVELFSDLKRHDMGPELAESFGSDLDARFITARLWGVADTAPYLHDGRAHTLRDAIMMNGGEAAGRVSLSRPWMRPDSRHCLPSCAR